MTVLSDLTSPTGTATAAALANVPTRTLTSVTGVYYLTDYYQSGDGTVSITGAGAIRDYYPAFNRIQDLVPDTQGAVVQCPIGDLGMSATFNLYKKLTIRGTNSGFQPSTATTRLLWNKNMTGIRAWGGAGEVGYAGPATANAAFACIEDVGIFCLDGSATSGHGIQMGAPLRLSRVNVQNWGGHGVYIFAANASQGSMLGNNANVWSISDSIIRSNKGCGLYVADADANAGVAHTIFGGNNGLWDFEDHSWFGNVYINCQSDGGGLGSFKGFGLGTLIGCYNESKATALDPGAFIIGGVLGTDSNSPLLTITGYSQTFNASSAVNSGTDKITLTSANTNFPVGYLVTYNSYDITIGGPAGTPVGGLTDGNNYYVVFADAATIKLSATLGGTAIDLTALGVSATHSLSLGTDAAAAVVLVDGSGTVTKVLPLRYGNNYTSATVVVSKEGDGSGLAVTANIVGGHVTSYTITNGGAGYIGLGGNIGQIRSGGSRGGLQTQGALVVQNYYQTSDRFISANLCYNGNQFFSATIANNGISDTEEFHLLDWSDAYKSYAVSLGGVVTMRWASSYGSNLTMGRASAIHAGALIVQDGYWLGGGQTGNFQTDGRYVGNGTAAPTTGQWARGDQIYNTAPSAGGPMGWMCVTTGDFAGSPPPVFKAMPNLAA